MDNKKITIENLSDEAKKELENLVNNQENAFDLLLNNFSGKQELTAKDVVSRMQMQYFAKNPIERELKTNDLNGWDQMEDYEPNEVNVGLASLVTTEDNSSFYSSFALKEVEGVYSLRYPLDDSFARVGTSFADDSMPDYEYNRLLQKLEKNLKVKVREDNVYTHSTYKTNFFKNAIIKIKNAFFKLTKNYDKIQVGYAGCIKLNNKQGNYVISNVEKVVKIYDSIFGATIKKQAYLMKKDNDVVINKDITFASRIYANLLMSRVTNFGNPEINRKIEKSLALQFANILNRNNFGPDQLKTITKLATNTAADACKSMGITTNQIIARMNLNGYDYSLVPTNEFEALLYYKERDYSQYNQGFAEKEPEVKVEPRSPETDKSPMETIDEIIKNVKEDNDGFNFIRNGRAKEKDNFVPSITSEQVNNAIKPNEPKYSVKKPLRGLRKLFNKIKNIYRMQNDAIKYDFEFELNEFKEEMKNPFNVIKNQNALDRKLREPKTEYNKITKTQIANYLGEIVPYGENVAENKPSKTKKKFSDLKIFRGIKNKIKRMKGIYKLKKGIISESDYDKFIEDAKGFGFIRNGVAHSKPKPEYDKITNEQIQYVLDKQSGKFLEAPKKDQKEILALPQKPEVFALPVGISAEAQMKEQAENFEKDDEQRIELIKNLAESLNKVIQEDNKKAKESEPKDVKIEKVVDDIIKIEKDNEEEPVKEPEVKEETIKKTFADKVIRGKIIATPEGNVANINQEQIQKLIDKVIEEHLKDISVKIDNAIATKQYYKYGGKKHCENIRELCMSTARYYTMHANNKAHKKIKTNNPVRSIDGMAKFACGMLLEERNNIITDMIEAQKDNGPERKVSKTGRYENIDTVINRMYRKYHGYRINKKIRTETDKYFIEADTIKGYFKTYIKKLMVEYGKFTKKETSTNK